MGRGFLIQVLCRSAVVMLSCPEGSIDYLSSLDNQFRDILALEFPTGRANN